MRLIHAELLKGELSDTAFVEMLETIIYSWNPLSVSALRAARHRIDSEPEIDTAWVDAIAHFSRMDQYQQHLLAAVNQNPGGPSSEESSDRYSLIGPGDF